MSTRTGREARERGSSTVEYALMVAALAAALVGVIMGAGRIASTAFDPCARLGAASLSSCADASPQEPAPVGR